MPKPKFELVPGTDAFYRITTENGYFGEVRKVYTGRSSYGWTLTPAHYEQRTTQRLVYSTRNEARDALILFGWSGNKSLVEG